MLKATQLMKLLKPTAEQNYQENKLKEDLVKIVKRDIEKQKAAGIGLDTWQAIIIEIH